MLFGTIVSFHSNSQQTNPAVQSNAYMFVKNLDKFPANDLLVFSRIQTPWSRDKKTYNANHDTVTVRIHNKGISPLIISKLLLSNSTAWAIEKLNGKTYSSSALPINISSGTYADIKIKFKALDQASRVKVLHATLTISSNDDAFPAKVVSLNGIWQKSGEGTHEPWAQEILEAFNLKTSTGFGYNDVDNGDPKKPKGDEIFPAYFVRADTSMPVVVRQMNAYHGCCNEADKIQWFTKGSSVLTTITTHIAVDAQTVLPHESSGAGAGEMISPPGAFGFNVGMGNTTDASKNPGKKIGVKVLKAIDSNGYIIPNSYILANDYLGSASTNYDYNDNMYFVSNLKPEKGSAFFSALGANHSDLDFGERVLQTTTSLQLTLSSFGKTYSDGSKDPLLVISSVSVTGDNKSEFIISQPAPTTLSPGKSTTLTIKFKPTSEGLKNADLLIFYNSSKSPYRVPLFAIGKQSTTLVSAKFRINSGSSASLTFNGKTWSADNKYSYDNLSPSTKKPVEIACTDNDALYLKQQSSDGNKMPFRYEIPIANGKYSVRLHFAELFWGAPGAGINGGAGSRVQSIKLENQYRLVNFDIVQQAGVATAIVKNFTVTVTDGKLNIDFSATENRPIVCGIEVYQFSAGASAQALEISATMLPLQKTLNDYNLSADVGKIKIYPNPVHTDFTIAFPATCNGIAVVELLDVSGRIFQTRRERLKAGGSKLLVNISELSLTRGIYLLRIQVAGAKTGIFKLLIE